jgi:hypothetical protein
MSEMEDLFGEVAQPVREAAPQRTPLTPDDVRKQMKALIATLREADVIPFEAAVMSKHVAMFPIMAQWLDEDEGAQLVFQFDAEVERLRKAA